MNKCCYFNTIILNAIMVPVQKRTTIMIPTAVLLAIGLVVGGFWLWGILANYIDPKTATERKELVNMFVLSGAGVVGSLTAIAAVGNLIVSRRNLEQQRALAERQASDDALQAYFEQMGRLLTEYNLKQTEEHDDLASLVRAQTLTVLRRLGAEGKRDVVLFLKQVGLVNRATSVRVILGAGGDLTSADLRGATLIRTDLRGANLRGTDLRGTDLTNADLTDADLRGTDLGSADLTDAIISKRQLATCNSLRRTTMPDGTRHD